MNESNDLFDAIGFWIAAAVTVALNLYPEFTLNSVIFAAMCLLVLLWRERSLLLRGSVITCLICVNWMSPAMSQLDDQIQKGRQTVFKRER